MEFPNIVETKSKGEKMYLISAYFDKDSFDNIYNALYTMGSSKLCRKTHLDMLTKVQVNMYVSGHHKEGSSAVKHNSSLILKDRFIFMCAAYKQLNVIEK